MTPRRKKHIVRVLIQKAVGALLIAGSIYLIKYAAGVTDPAEKEVIAAVPGMIMGVYLFLSRKEIFW